VSNVRFDGVEQVSPAGTSLKLLSLIERKGLDAIA